MTEQDGSAPTPRPGGEPSGERIVIRNRRRIDPTGGTRSKSSESGGHRRPDPSARSSNGRDETADRDPATSAELAEPAELAELAEPAGVADTEAKAEDDSGASVRHAGRGEPEATTAGPDEDGEESTEAAVRAELGSESAEAEQTAGTAPTDDTVGDVDVLRPLGVELEALRAELDERIRDLQRITAEYANYRKRVDRDRGLVAEQATGAVLSALLPVLDDLDRARDHGDLVGPFGAVAEQLAGTLAKFGLCAFGEKGDPFDPTRHEAVAHLTSADVSESTCVDIMRRGYLLGDRLLRPALVAVADPE